MEDRRGFLKTLGKLAAAVGITTAVATVPTKAKMGGKPIIEKIEWGKPMHETPVNRGYAARLASNPHTVTQEQMNAFYNQVIDTKHMEMMPPPMVVPQHIYDFMRRKEAIRSLDPYNWGAVFDMKWVDWNQPTNFATSIGRWEARVKPQFRDIIDGEVYTQSKEIAMDYLRSSVANSDVLLNYAKEQCYRELVDSLQDVILERIKRDVKDTPLPGPPPYDILTGHISNRDEFFTKNPDAAKRITE